MCTFNVLAYVSLLYKLKFSSSGTIKYWGTTREVQSNRYDIFAVIGFCHLARGINLICSTITDCHIEIYRDGIINQHQLSVTS